MSSDDGAAGRVPVRVECGAPLVRYVALYCRISIDRRGRKEGVQAQERWGREYAAQMWPGLPVRVFPDNDLTAADDSVDRPEYARLRAAIGAGEVAHVWTVEQYRIERREVAWFEFAAIMDAAGISELHTNRDGIVRVRDEVAGIKAVLGAGEVRRLKKRINDTLAEKAALGEPAGSRPFGYLHGKTADGTKTYVIVAAQAAAIRQAAEWVLAGWSLTNIAAELRRQGLRGGQGGEIRKGAVRGMVTNPTVAGYRVYQGRITGRGNWAPILDDQTWKACRLKLSQPREVARSDGGTYFISENHTGYSGRRYLLTGGLSVCGVCGNRLTGTLRPTRTKEKKPILLCHRNAGGSGCVGVVLEPAEKFVVGELFAALDNPDFLAAIGADQHGARRDQIASELESIDEQRGVLAAMWATPGELSLSEWQQARRAFTDNERALRTELAALPAPAVKVKITGAREGWEYMTLDEQREFVRLFIKKVTVSRARPGIRSFDPDRITIEWVER